MGEIVGGRAGRGLHSADELGNNSRSMTAWRAMIACDRSFLLSLSPSPCLGGDSSSECVNMRWPRQETKSLCFFFNSRLLTTFHFADTSMKLTIRWKTVSHSRSYHLIHNSFSIQNYASTRQPSEREASSQQGDGFEIAGHAAIQHRNLSFCFPALVTLLCDVSVMPACLGNIKQIWRWS